MSEISCRTIEIAFENFNALSGNTSDVKLYRIKLSAYYDLIPKLKAYLNVTELQRARKYHFKKDTNQFIICRALLKFILAHHSGQEVSDINIEMDTNKKPYMSSHKSICFNLSHATDYAIIGVKNEDAVGIDIEYLNNDFNFSEIMPDIFSNPEIDIVLNATHKTRAFYKFWTRKEAIVKATGTGISDFLPKIPALDGNHLIDSKLIDGCKSLQVFSFDLDEHYIASIALSTKNFSFDKLLVNNLPRSIKGLLEFSHLKNS
jgi:4'-phosphopantetheinyl transferase